MAHTALFFETVNVTTNMHATTTLITWPVGGSIECLGGCYETSIGLAVAAVWESPIYFDRVEDCHALKVLLGIFLYGFMLSGREDLTGYPAEQ